MLIPDVESTQKHLVALQNRFGKMKQFKQDLTVKDGLYNAAYGEHSRVKPNNLQRAVAQYALGILGTTKRVLVSSHAGSGKSRMQAALVLMTLLTEFSPSVHVVFPDEHLMNRDKVDFEALWALIGCTSKVHHHVGIRFERNPQDLLVIDEADYFIFD
jgi:hypothetical protein